MRSSDLRCCQCKSARIVGALIGPALLLLALFLLAHHLAAAGNGPDVSPHTRFGVCVVSGRITRYAVEQLHAGWYLDFGMQQTPPHPAGLEYVQTVRVKEGQYDPAAITQTLGPKVDANRGALWLIGNEPDRRGFQDDRTPWAYAGIYHDLYQFLKRRDPTSRVAVGGVVQVTPLRLRYLELALAEYQARYGTRMPVDVWNVHAFILREDWTWGAGIPPGMDDYAELGKLYEVDDNDNIELLKEQIRTFRQWLAERDERDKPLIVSEYGVQMPELYGFDHDRVKRFMYASFDFFLTAADDQLGYPADANRLVQRWAWYSLDDRMYDLETGRGFNGNLFDPDTRAITSFGLDYGFYTAPDLTLTGLSLEPARPATQAAPITVTIAVSVVNVGLSPATNAVLRFWHGDPTAGGWQIGPDHVIPHLPSGVANGQRLRVIWSDLPPGRHPLYVRIDPDHRIQETNEANNGLAQAFLAAAHVYWLPVSDAR